MTTDIKSRRINDVGSTAKGLSIQKGPKALKIKEPNERVNTDAKTKSYNRLISGNLKASGIGVTEMLDMIDSAQDGTAVMEEPIQGLISALLLGRTGTNSTASSSFEVPYVPNLHEDIFKYNPELQEHPETILERYQAQRNTLEDLLKSTEKFLAPPTAATMTPDEIMALFDHRKDVVNALSENKKQLSETMYYYEWAKAKRAAAAEEANKKLNP